jgi:hypothetical protein
MTMCAFAARHGSEVVKNTDLGSIRIALLF